MSKLQTTAIQRPDSSRFQDLLAGLALAAVISLVSMTAAHAQGLPFTEDFTTNTLEDTTATTADWDTTAGSLKLPLSTSATPVQSLNGTFSAASLSSTVDVSADLITRAVALGDLDGDGDLDIAFGNNGSNRFYFNDGTGNFIAGAAIPGVNDHFGGGNTRSARIADFNGDGHLDVLYSEFGEGQPNRILFNNGSGTTDISSQLDFEDLGPATLKGDGTAIGDIDRDGDLDVVIGVRGDFVQFFLNDGFGNFSAANPISDPLGASNIHARSVALGDVNNDGWLDVVAALQFGTTRVYYNNTTGGFNAPLVAGAGTQNKLAAPDSLALGDVNGDGWLDIVLGNDGSDSDLTGDGNTPGVTNHLFIHSTSPADPYPNVVAFTADMADTNGLQLADVDRDGDLDIVTADLVNVTTPDTNRLYINDGAGNFGAAVLLGGDVALTKSIAVGDLDGDGALDVVTANEPTAVAGSGVNKVVLNGGTLSGTPADQLYATAASLRVDSGENLDNGVILSSSLLNAAIANPVFRYWLSADGGTRWVAVQPGRSTQFPASGLAQDLRWRIDMNTASGAAAWRPAVDSISIVANQPARITSTAVTDATQDVLYTYNITTNDPDNESVEISAPTLPTWLTLTDNGDGTATLEGTPTNDNVGTAGNDVVIEAVDSSEVVGFSGSQSFTIMVANVNDAPTVVAPTGDQTFAEGETVDLDASAAFEDIDAGDVLTYSATGLPASLSIDMMTGVISGTLTNDDFLNGPDYAVVVTAQDGSGETADDTFTLTVTNVNAAPTFTSAPVTAAVEGTAYTYNISVDDADGDTIAITAAALPAWLTLTDNGDGTATLTGTPGSGDVGSAAITLTADDSTTTTDQAFTITVSAAPAPPPPPRTSGSSGSFGPLGILFLVGMALLGRRRARLSLKS